ERADAAGFDGFAAVALHPAEPVPHDATEATRLWVRKEAVLKALGSGLRLDPRELRLAGCLDSTGANRSSEKPRVLAWPDPRPPSIVELCDLDAPAGYLAALAVIGGRGAAYTQAAIRLDTSSGV
ncbi:MAG TPA: 4'-phosphopantetheinyl transferase superfamily protein, partial [Micropruina sp.]|nr:4'-phosphopantetheinyl transferase superfamily protein [Micropruina sp.]